MHCSLDCCMGFPHLFPAQLLQLASHQATHWVQGNGFNWTWRSGISRWCLGRNSVQPGGKRYQCSKPDARNGKVNAKILLYLSLTGQEKYGCITDTHFYKANYLFKNVIQIVVFQHERKRFEEISELQLGWNYHARFSSHHEKQQIDFRNFAWPERKNWLQQKWIL